MPTCPECDAMIAVEEDLLEEGQTVECPECGAELEVVSTEPVEFDILSRDDNENEDEDFDVDDEDKEEP
jgi:alpha-aminoadipate carrier protein LysW